jgi:hypothetical protein
MRKLSSGVQVTPQGCIADSAGCVLYLVLSAEHLETCVLSCSDLQPSIIYFPCGSETFLLYIDFFQVINIQAAVGNINSN